MPRGGGGPGQPVLIRLCAVLRVERGSDVVAPAELGSRKGRTLLALLAANRRQLVPFEDIVRALWPAEAPADPAAVIASLVSRLRGALGAAAIIGGRSGYQLARSPLVVVDLDRARALLEEAESCLAAAMPVLAGTAAQAARRDLGDGMALPEHLGEPWADGVRAEVAGLRRRGRHTAAAAALATGDAAHACELAREAVRDDRLDESATRLLMAGLLALGEPGKALRAFENLRTVLAGELGTDPATETQELHLAALRGEAPPTRRRTRTSGRLRLVGRDAEFGALRDLWAGAIAGRPRCVLLCGEAGIGKTRLAQETADLATRTGCLVLTGRCYASEQSFFAQPMVDAIGKAVVHLPADRITQAAAGHEEVLSRLVPEIARVLGDHSGTSAVTVATEQQRYFLAVQAFLRGLSQTTPVLVTLDDLQHAGQSTTELLLHLMHRLEQARVMVLATVREDEAPDMITDLGPDAAVVRLGPLSATAVSQLASSVGQQEHSGEILRRTGGHPLFVVETLRALASGRPGLPESLQAAVLDRVRRTGTDTERLLRAGAVLGATFEPAVAAALVDVPEQTALDALERALAARLLLPVRHEYEFAHDIVREVLLETTPAPTRLANHRRAADLLAANPEAVAVHAEAAGDDTRAGRAWLMAGEQALGRFAGADAATLASRAITLATRLADPELRGRALLVRGRARDATADFQPAFADYLEARQCAHEAGDRRLEMQTLRELAGDVPVALGRAPATCEPPLRECLAIAQSLGDRAVEADVLDRLTVLACSRLDFGAAAQLAQRALTAGRAAGDGRALACGLDAMKAVHAYLGNVRELAAIIAELEPLQRRSTNLWMLQWTVFESAFIPLAAGDIDEAVQRVESAVQVCHRSGYVVNEPFFLAHLGWAYRLCGRLDDALEAGQRAVAPPEPRHRHAWWAATSSSLLAGTLLAYGRRDEAVALLESVRTAADEPGAETYLLRCLGPLAEASGSREVLDQATALLQTITTPPGAAWLLGADCYLGIARAWTAHGEPARAAAVLEPFRAAALRAGWPALVDLADQAAP